MPTASSCMQGPLSWEVNETFICFSTRTAKVLHCKHCILASSTTLGLAESHFISVCVRHHSSFKINSFKCCQHMADSIFVDLPAIKLSRGPRFLLLILNFSFSFPLYCISFYSLYNWQKRIAGLTLICTWVCDMYCMKQGKAERSISNFIN